MDPNIKHIIIYTTYRGKSPFVEWMKKLKDIRAIQIIQARIRRLSSGNYGDCKSVGEGIFECRIPFGPGYRIYFAEVNNEILIILIAGDKSTQNDDIKKAKNFWKGHKENKES